MTLPAVGRLPGLSLEYARGGHALFNPQDAALAGELISMLRHAFDSLAAYEKGAAEERSRIARDMHDNIGAQLLSALHSADAKIKDARIRESMMDLRAVINEASGGVSDLGQALAELRIETAERLEAAGIALKWSIDLAEGRSVPGSLRHAIRSIIREATSNAIRHSGCTELAITLCEDTGSLHLEISDDGRGIDLETVRRGRGLDNMRSRLAALGGSFDLADLSSGTRLSARIPAVDASCNQCERRLLST